MNRKSKELPEKLKTSGRSIDHMAEKEKDKQAKQENAKSAEPTKDREDMNADEVAEEQKQEEEEVKKELKGLFGGSSKFFTKLLDIKQDTDQDATRKAIIEDIPFRGHTAWILICSIFICSVGLNANSTAVVIGAMLIAPLMGPILGIGMSLAINDLDTLKRSLVHFTIMIILSILTAFLFFKLFPLREESSELLARIEPDIRDVVIAFFGGLALAIARAKRGTIASVIYGAAIGTALMPPLCTVGFGLAIGNFSYAGGALYLFTINSIFIALATFLTMKYLRFPMVKYANSKKRRVIARIVSVVAILVMIPAGFTFYNTLQESRYRSQAVQYIQETIGSHNFKGEGRFMENLTKINYVKDGKSTIQLVAMGEERISDEVTTTWRNRLNEYSRLADTELSIIQGAEFDMDGEGNYMTELYELNKSQLLTKDSRIGILEKELSQLKKSSYDVLFKEVSSEANALFGDLEEFGFAWRITTNFEKIDTIPVFEIKWRNSLPGNERLELQQKLNKWLKVRLNNEQLRVEDLDN